MRKDRTKLFRRCALCLTLLAAAGTLIPVMQLSAAVTADADDDTFLTTEEYEALDWSALAVPDVDDYLNVRADADKEAQIIGRIYPGAVVEVVEEGTEWTQISSGDVEGYAATDYLLFGADAQAAAEESMTCVAVVTGDDVRIRAQESTDAEIITKADTGDTFGWDTQTQTSEEWVAVIYGDETCFISADFVQTGISQAVALTTEEVQETDTASYSDADLDLLAALIYCEARGESYAGKLAVGAVVMNRVESSRFPDTVSDVIYQSGQFSPASSGSLKKALKNGSATGECYEAAREALSGESNVGDCLYFHAGSGSGTQIGNQVFY